MQGKIIKEEIKTPEFKEFKLELTVSSLEHARLLFHVFNNRNLSDVINGGGNWYNMDEFTRVSGDLSRNKISENIEEYIEELGFKI